ncbi:Beta-galactosidase [Cucumis melo var. makuwa]|uniref:Beta-galactosidase n=1 Tax=Cucumis melo var. makuwa TaxID=1194695 RepID=A0A5D3BUT6_CUCMM|nr:Beta-galactosidase [Cucumis melo var. makuwa]TYK01996.1 Beta-galactosidase [Cucumis melo var. makuwa]
MYYENPEKYLALHRATYKNDTGTQRTLSSICIDQQYGTPIGKPLLFAATAKDIWDMHQNASRLYTLRKQIHECKQEAMDFDVVRGRILGQRPISSLMEVCSEICLEEDRTSAMNISTTPSIDSTAFSVRFSTSGNDKYNGKPIPALTHASNVSESARPSQPPESQGNQIKHGPATLYVIVQSDHLTGSSEHFVSYTCASNETIRIANGSLAPIAGKRKISPCVGSS